MTAGTGADAFVGFTLFREPLHAPRRRRIFGSLNANRVTTIRPFGLTYSAPRDEVPIALAEVFLREAGTETFCWFV